METIELALREGKRTTVKVLWAGQWMAIHRALKPGTDDIDPHGAFRITHKLSGCTVWTFYGRKLAEVKIIAAALERMGPDDIWDFTDPRQMQPGVGERMAQVLQQYV